MTLKGAINYISLCYHIESCLKMWYYHIIFHIVKNLFEVWHFRNGGTDGYVVDKNLNFWLYHLFSIRFRILNWILNFKIDNDFASCFASLNKKMIQISTNYYKLVFVLQKCTTKTLQQRCRIQKFSQGNTPDLRFRGRQSLFSEKLPAVILTSTRQLIIAMHSLHLSTCALFEIMENGQSIFQKFILIIQDSIKFPGVFPACKIC